MSRSRRQPGIVEMSADGTYGVVFLRDGRRVLWGADLGELLLIHKHGDAHVEIMLASQPSMDRDLWSFAMEEGDRRPLSEDGQGYWEWVVALIRPHATLAGDKA